MLNKTRWVFPLIFAFVGLHSVQANDPYENFGDNATLRCTELKTKKPKTFTVTQNREGGKTLAAIPLANDLKALSLAQGVDNESDTPSLHTLFETGYIKRFVKGNKINISEEIASKKSQSNKDWRLDVTPAQGGALLSVQHKNATFAAVVVPSGYDFDYNTIHGLLLYQLNYVAGKSQPQSKKKTNLMQKNPNTGKTKHEIFELRPAQITVKK